MNKIHVMNEILANKIAAGEVVERAMSVVKELVENSIDAGANNIMIQLTESGTKMIRVIDNGSGMNKEDAKMAFYRHATSKIIDDEDLFNINTLGFRGEALASIAAVSKVILKTNDGESSTKVVIEAGIIKEVITSSCNKGTDITISDLFFNTPARLKHMKSLYTELASIVDYIEKISLSYPNISFKLINDEKVILSTEGNGDLLKVIHTIYGLEVARNMLYINGSNDDYEIKGYVCKPNINKTNKSGMVTLINNRVIRNTELNREINDAYHTYKPDNRYPYVVINIECDPELVDVNVHPTKMDIKFGKFDELIVLIKDLITTAISYKELIPTASIKSNNQVRETSNEQEVLRYEETTLSFDSNIEEKEEEYKEYLKEMDAVGIVHGTYIVAQNDEGMYLIDQHAAKERINYEIIKTDMASPKHEVINVIVPYVFELSNSEYIIFVNNSHIFIDLGFVYDEIGINTIRVSSTPNWLPKGNEKNAIYNIISYIISLENKFNLSRFRESLAIMVSCKMSIKANTNISIDEMNRLINDLRKCINPYTCPHGRPTVIKLTKEDLENMFKRSGF